MYCTYFVACYIYECVVTGWEWWIWKSTCAANRRGSWRRQIGRARIAWNRL